MEGGGGAGGGGLGGWPWELGNSWSSGTITPSSSTAQIHRFPDGFEEAATHVPSYYRSFMSSGTQDQLTCLKLGKRQVDDMEVGIGAVTAAVKRHAVAVPVPRCQVEGCGKPLGDAKEYHRRHKVCEAHSKAPKVVVLGAEQRFCQQCSRFHAISEFDDAKRSCRRRLAGHNERRRKSSSDSMTLRNTSQLENTVMGNSLSYISSNSSGRALSLLSSKPSPWFATSDLSSRSSAALRELIAENRAAILARQLFSDRGWHTISPENPPTVSAMPSQSHVQSETVAQLTNGCYQTQVTLDLMQTPGLRANDMPGRSKSKEEEEDCFEIWKSLEGTHVL